MGYIYRENEWGFSSSKRDQTQFRICWGFYINIYGSLLDRYEEPIAKSLFDENPFGWALREIERKHERYRSNESW